MKKPLLIALAGMLLAACAAGDLYEYAKPGGSKQQMQADQSACSSAAIKVPAGAKLSAGEKAIIEHMRNQQHRQFSDCMKSKGYELIAID